MEQKKARPIAATLLAAILILGLMGAALAAVGSEVLTYLFGDDETTDAQRQSVQTVDASCMRDGVTTTVTDCLLDGVGLSVGLTI